jgi:hypothetical protein
MRQKESRSTDDKWVGLLKEALYKNERRPVGVGWVTVVELATKLKVGTDRAYSLVSEMVAKKKIEKFVGAVKLGKRMTRRVWYRPL